MCLCMFLSEGYSESGTSASSYKKRQRTLSSSLSKDSKSEMKSLPRLTQVGDTGSSVISIRKESFCH